MTTKKQLKLEEMNASEYRVFLQQQAYELRAQARKASGDPQATIEGATDAAKAKATQVMDSPKVALADERRVSAPSVGNADDKAPAPAAIPVADSGKSTAETNPPQVKQTTVSDDQAKK